MRVTTAVAPAYNPAPKGCSSGIVSTQRKLSVGSAPPSAQVSTSLQQVLPSSGQLTMPTSQWLAQSGQLVLEEEKQADPEPANAGEPSQAEERPHDVASESSEQLVKDGASTPLGTGAPITSADDVARTQIEEAKTDPMNPNVSLQTDPNS